MKTTSEPPVGAVARDPRRNPNETLEQLALKSKLRVGIGLGNWNNHNETHERLKLKSQLRVGAGVGNWNNHSETLRGPRR